MARLFEPAKYDGKSVLDFLSPHKANDYYKEKKIGFVVNDGKYIEFVDDREEADEYLKKLKKE